MPREEGVQTDALPPVFCFQYLQPGFDFDAIKALPDEIKALLKRIDMIRKMDWRQIEVAPHIGAGCEAIPRDQIKPAIPRELTEDMTILAFRCNKKMRLIGWRNGRILHVVWIDPNHEVYDG